MKKVIVLMLATFLCLSAQGFAALVTTSNEFDYDATVADKNALITGVPNGGAFAGGDNIGTAVVIPGLPFHDTGNTCMFLNDYDEVCPYSYSTSADVVYSFSPSQDVIVTIDLCASLYDTKVYVYRNAYTPGAPYACNDDAGCGITGYQSKLANLTLYGDEVWYIVIDGYGGDCGNYVLDITEYVPCVVTCPEGALLEGEPTCDDSYVDNYNGGCNSTPYVYQVLQPSCQTITLCGTSGVYGGAYYRDTDWFQITTLEQSDITFCCTAEFKVQLYIVDMNAGCDYATVIAEASADPCGQACIQYTFPVGTYVLWVGPYDWNPLYTCGSDYVMTVDGYGPGYPSAAEQSTWGSIKSILGK